LVDSEALPPADDSVVAFVVAAIVGEITTVTLLWDLGLLLAIGGMPLGGAILGVCAARLSAHIWDRSKCRKYERVF
jgi:hypothetical protein